MTKYSGNKFRRNKPEPTQAQRNWAIRALQERSRQLGRLPEKADFDDAARARIKTFLGPWPRALEAAGLKSPKVQDRCQTKIPTK